MKREPRLLLTSVMKPLGTAYGDAESVGYELLHAQVTRVQGMFSPRAVHKQFSLDYIAENLDNPAVVLHYPSRRELIREIKKGYDYVGISFIVVTYHRMKEIAGLVRKHSPGSKIILGGFGTALPDSALEPWCDHICRGEGVSFMRELLGQERLERHKHPVLSSELRVFSKKVSYTGMIFAGLGCPNGCDFCSTSHFFKRRHLRLLSTGADIYNVISKHLEINPDAQFTILDEEFLLDRKRALELRDKVLEGGRPLSIFAFASVKALSLYEPRELVEMGVDGVWIGFEGERSGYDKRSGKAVESIFRGLKENGVTILASMIVGFDYQTPRVIERELKNLLDMEPDLCQFMIYNPNPGTPLYERAVAGDLLRPQYRENPELYWKVASGFKSLLKHPAMSADEIETAQKKCFETDFRRLGPSIYRVAGTMFNGYLAHRDSPSAFLRMRAMRLARELRKSYPIFLAGELFGPNAEARGRVSALKKRLHAEFGRPTLPEKALALAAGFAALWTELKLRLNIFQHPKLQRNSYRLPPEGFIPAWLKEKFAEDWKRLSVKVYEDPRRRELLVRLEGILERAHGAELSRRLEAYLRENKGRLVLDMARVKSMEKAAAEDICEKLKAYKSRIKISLPAAAGARAAQFLFMAEVFKNYKS